MAALLQLKIKNEKLKIEMLQVYSNYSTENIWNF